MADKPGDIELVKGCARGDRRAQKALYDQYAERMMMMCYRYVADKSMAKDVLMEAFYDVFKNIGRYAPRDGGSLHAWISKIVINRCLMHLRKAQPVWEETDGVEETLPDDEDIGGRLNAKEIMALIHALPPGYRTVFNLYVFEDFSHKEIARHLGISESTSKTQLYKAKALLQKKIKADDERR